MWAARALLAHGAAEAPFRIAAALWVVGGVGFTWFAGLGCLEGTRSARTSAPARPRCTAPDASGGGYGAPIAVRWPRERK